ncbi:MAG: chitobiase/beta-hexosaminidase C-terminal domain-containing protein [Oscillospiraceae bacterium]|nr:chitobiase/beta-hexosaminidase C-terminal domain-containing protein [Oscillospiraceae bacterium]
MKKRILSAVLAAAFMLGAFGGAFAVEAGAASKWSGYTKISKPEDLLKMKDSVKKFYLANDIDLGDYGNWVSFNFSGTLDGDGYAIKNLSSIGKNASMAASTDASSAYGGLFNKIENAAIKNLGLIDVNVSVDSGSMGYPAVGGIANMAFNADIENCYVSGSVAGRSNSSFRYYGLGFAGGLVGFTGDTVTFKNCVNLAKVNLSGGSTGYSVSAAGGIIGNGYASVFINCVNAGKVNFAPSHEAIKGNAGGIAGSLTEGRATSCYNTGQVTSLGKSAAPGDIIGYAGESVVLKDCVYRKRTDNKHIGGSEDGFTGKASRKSASTMKKQTTYKGFDFDKTWYADAGINSGYPILQDMLANYNASKPTANKKAGAYAKDTEITLSTKLKGVTIRYTTDGKAPTASSKKYSKAIKLTKNTTVKAAVFTGEGERGKVVTFKYTVK